MRVEVCCQSLLAYLLPEIDPDRTGFCIDVGVGTFAFYCEIFAKLGFSTIAVEPLPVNKLRKLSQQYGITLIESCLSDQDGTQSLYLGSFAGLFNHNFNSLAADWFGSSRNSKAVSVMSLPTFIENINAQKITVLKLDIEGWEYNVIKQLPQLNPKLLPQVMMFEYGGGVNKNQGQKGWSKDFLAKTLHCLAILKDCGYGSSLMIDFDPQSQEQFFDLQSLDIAADSLFSNNSVYGNIISTLGVKLDQDAIASICRPYHRVNMVEWLVNKLVSKSS
jgi:FkbM family methyltransferase